MKPVHWLGDSLKSLKRFPSDVQDEIGYALLQAQLGGKHPAAKPLREIGKLIYEVVSEYRTDTFRGVYTVNFPDRIYVLHCFQKKSKTGVATPKAEIDLIKERFKAAEQYAKANPEKR